MSRRRHVTRAGWALAAGLTAAVALAACSGPPTGDAPDAGGDDFAWQIDVSELDEALLAVWAAGDDAIAVGGADEGLVIEWHGGAPVIPVLPPDTGVLWWTWALPGATSDAYAVGEHATILRRAGGVWRREALEDGLVDPRVNFYGVWGSAADDVWVVGGSFNPGVTPGVILHWDGLLWTSFADPLVDSRLLFKVWGGGAVDDVWAVGEGGAILHWSGGAWTDVASGTPSRLIAIAGRARDEVYAVGGEGNGVLLQWDGMSWASFASVIDPLSAVWTAPGRALYVGGRGLLLRFGAGDRGTPDPAVVATAHPLTDVDFHALVGFGTGADDVVSGVYAVGADLLGAGGQGWRGALVSHGAALAPVILPPRPDAGPPDAHPVDAAVDGMPPDAHWPANGELCAFDPMAGYYCAGGFTCWQLIVSDAIICTDNCATAADCAAYGPGACCVRPGPQTLETVCIPGSYTECM